MLFFLCIISMTWGECESKCYWGAVVTVDTSTAKPLAVTSLVLVSGNTRILHIWKLSTGLHSSSLHVCSLSESLRGKISIQCFSFCLCHWSSVTLFLINYRIESRMSKSAANQRSPGMVTESTKAVTSAAVDVTSGSKVSISVSYF